MKWHRGWFPLSRVAKEINEADICLGVFGGAEKSARVLPFKVYYALAAGKAVVTQRLMSLPDGVPLPPIANAEGGDPDTLASSLAAAILRLAGDAELRQSLGKAASAYYSTHLSDAAIAVRWRAMLRNLMTQSSS